MTVTTRAAVSFSFSVVFFRDLYTLRYIFHDTLALCVFDSTYCRGCVIDLSKSRPGVCNLFGKMCHFSG